MTHALLALALLAADPSPEPDDPAADLKKMQGAWAIAEVRGKDAFPADLKGMKFVFEKDTLKLDAPGVAQPAVKFKLAHRRGVGEIDVESQGGEGPSLGLYKFEKGRLILCGARPGKPRPKRFDDPNAEVVVLQRPAK